uniref:Uncharacterized protein n=2 Tax=Avena sativa TaxID=4498 RepID=A0ACD5WP64_AVESA
MPGLALHNHDAVNEQYICGHIDGLILVHLVILSELGGQCSWGKIPIDLLCSSLDDCVTLSVGHTVHLTLGIRMSPGFIKPTFLKHGTCLTFCSQKADATGSYELQATIAAEEACARETREHIYNSYSYDNISPSLLPFAMRLRPGNVRFNYWHCKKLLQDEVTENFSCSICWVRCGSFKGLEYHLTSSHELFHFDFVVFADCQVVNIRLKVDNRRAELLGTAGEGDKRSEKDFFYRSRSKKRFRRLETSIEKSKHVHPHIRDIVESRSPGNMGHVYSHTTESGSSKDAHKGSEVHYVPNETGISVPQASIDSHPAPHVSNHSIQPVLEFAKSTKLSVDRADPRNRLLLQKREFFHSQKAQRMEIEEVLADHDSEDEIDDDIADIEDMTMLNGLSDVTKDEKRIMHMWNSFVRKQRVLADAHIPWACKAFSEQHGQELVRNPALRWCWRFVMIKLWNHSLLDARTMDTCNKYLDDLESGSSAAGPKKT